ncbi:MAG: hypothetical protein JST12_14720 [Armatimonadetes bacterium]|nr:hypothetical protein [Armatimonadota bacterium]
MQDNTLVGTLTIGGSSVLGDLKDVSCRFQPDHNNTKALNNYGVSRQISKMGITFTVGLYSTITADDVRVDFFNITAVTLGGTDIRCDLYSFEVEGTFTRKADPGFCSRWKTMANKSKDYKATLEVGISDAGYAALVAASASTVEADRRMDLVATVNGVGITIQVTLGEIQNAFEDEDNQRVTFTVMGNAPSDGSDYPTAPTGVATLLTWAFNGSKSTKAISFKSNNAAGVGVAIDGNVTLASFKFGCRDGEVLVTTYELESYGTMTVAPTA